MRHKHKHLTSGARHNVKKRKQNEGRSAAQRSIGNEVKHYLRS